VNLLKDISAISVQLPGINPEEAIEKIGRTALLQFCEPVQNASGDVAIMPASGSVEYQVQTCEPLEVFDAEGNTVAALMRDEDGEIVAESGELEFASWPPETAEVPYTSDLIVWQPASAELDGEVLTLDGNFLQTNTFVFREQVLQRPILQFEWDGTGADISEAVTERLVTRNYPLAPFLDGEPIRGDDGRIIAPNVQGVITNQGSISGLSQQEAQELSTLLNTGAFPVPLRVVQQQDVDATLGETAVRNSVIAGEVALLLIMLFMVAYYRLPGLIASLALVIYTAFSLAVFKIGLPDIGPIVLTLGGVAAFVLSLGMAIDANVLIFERMKEELRVGRNLIVALDDGFNRAWSSIRDSNISTFITCIILYWFGARFDEASIKGFAIVLAIGVAISMFSAITVTRTFMRLIVSYRPIARRLWLFIPDLPEDLRQPTRGAPAIAGGSGDSAGQPPVQAEER
jgi:preprotein translocase subunit SecD